MEILTWVLWGLFVGAIARLLKPGRMKIGILPTMFIGVTGSVLGGLVADRALGIGGGDDFDLGSFFIAVLTSIVLLAIYGAWDRALGSGLDERRRAKGDLKAGGGRR
jgi:uncharacterized membrane protein YeaQ/YmgE (transglycosylase-associated protein family)